MTDTPIVRPHAPDVDNGHVPNVAYRVHERVAPPPPPAGPVYIGLITRAIAFAVDAAIVNLVAVTVAGASALIISIFPVGHTFKVVIASVGALLWILWLVTYFASFWSTTGQTPGNRLFRIRVIRVDGSDMHFLGGVVRLGALVLATLPLGLGLAPILFNERRRGLQDVIAKTAVIDASEGAPA